MKTSPKQGAPSKRAAKKPVEDTPSPVAAATARLEERVRPLITAALVGGLSGAALAGAAIVGGRLWRRVRTPRPPEDPPA